MANDESAHSAPISYQTSFYEYDADGQVDPINPW
jgi:hypothetical protein